MVWNVSKLWQDLLELLFVQHGSHLSTSQCSTCDMRAQERWLDRCVHSLFSMCLWNICFEPDSVLGTGNKAMNKTKLNVLIRGNKGRCELSQEGGVLCPPSLLNDQCPGFWYYYHFWMTSAQDSDITTTSEWLVPRILTLSPLLND